MWQLLGRRVLDSEDVLLVDLEIDRQIVEARIHPHNTLGRAAEVAEQPHLIAGFSLSRELLD